MHGNSEALCPRPHTLQARATLQKIIAENTDQLPNEFSLVGSKQVNNLKVVLFATNWNHMHTESKSSKPLILSFVTTLMSAVRHYTSIMLGSGHLYAC